MADVSREVSEYSGKFIGAFIAVTIAVSLIPTLLASVANISGVPLLTVAIVGTVVGAGVVLYLVKAFL